VIGSRTSQLKELLHFSRPVADVVSDLSAFGWDSDEELVTLEAAHISTVLNRFLAGDISAADVEDWANAIECREDIGLFQGSPVADALDELANPVLTRPLTRGSAAEWVVVLSGAAT
jgi:hypothetical protein